MRRRARTPFPRPRGKSIHDREPRSCAEVGLLAPGSLYSRTFPRRDSRDTVVFPVSFPATVAGTAPASNRLP